MVDITNWDNKKNIEVDSTATAPSEGCVATLYLDGSASEGKTGNGTIGYDTTNVSDATDVVFTESDETTLRDYYIENPSDLGTTTTVIVHIYDAGWTADGSVQVVFGYGSGSTDNQNESATFANSGNDETFFYDLNGDANDSVGSNNGTISGASSISSAQFAGGYSFDGVGDSIDSGYDGSENNYSVEFWLNIDSLADYNFVIGDRESSGGWGVLVGADGDVVHEQQGKTNLFSSTGVISTGTWHHVLVTNSDSSGQTIYVDGVQEGTNSETGGGNPTTNAIKIGVEDSGSYDDLPGDVDHVTYYDSAVKPQTYAEARYEMSSKAGQVFFSQQAAEATQSTTTVSVSETLGVSEQRDEEAQFFRAFSEALGLNDVDVKKVLKLLETESLGVNDFLSKAFFKTVQENLGFTAQATTNYGVLTGTVDLQGNPVQGAYVYVFNKDTEEFEGFDTTDVNGEYTIRSLEDNQIYLVAVDYDDSGTLYGDEKSINLNDTNN